MYNLYWFPNPEIHRDEIDTLSSKMSIENAFLDAFRYRDNLEWKFDGDGWSTDNVIWERWPEGNYVGEVGTFYISSVMFRPTS